MFSVFHQRTPIKNTNIEQTVLNKSSACSHPQQGFLGVGVVFVSCCLHTLSDCFSQHALFLDLPQVLIGLLTRLLHKNTTVLSYQRNLQRDRYQIITLSFSQDSQRDRCSDRQVLTSYSLWASSSRAPGAMEAILKMSWQTRGTS